MKKVDDLLNRNKKLEDKIKTFDDLLGKLSSTEDRKKALWKEIYENAISDREKASILFTEAYKTMSGNSSDHVTMGTIMTKYLERMCKSNAQILSLADIISKAELENLRVDPNDLFSKISED